MRLPPPTTISPQAQTLLRDAPAITARSIELSAIQERRQASAAFYVPVVKALADSLDMTITEEMIGGVRTQVVTPANIVGNSAILYFFGGGYVQGSPDEDLGITARLAHLTCSRVYAPYYALAPERPYPQALEDGLKVYQALVARYGAPALTVSGESAGGGLALSLLLKITQQPAKAALMSPWSDLTKTGDTLSTLVGNDPWLHYELTLEPAARAYAGARDLAAPELSPIYANFPADFPKTLITTGTRDLFLSDCARLSTKMRAAGIACELRVFEGMWHVFEFEADLPEADQSLAEIAAFIRG
ncbi:alpha/beta hydrolase [Dongia rigui]|uniref:Alpha/beta hydrolase n=1 Tax=Dongia rigui TaxID=940149 RepID=A0ABU5E3J8_9PROT|nr:alpha/beta hydrolase [Dongia rigui]MDY0874093.1 alpha/beta hydrolase [Dongia rigui]